jgi:hypothetical protein
MGVSVKRRHASKQIPGNDYQRTDKAIERLAGPELANGLETQNAIITCLPWCKDLDFVEETISAKTFNTQRCAKVFYLEAVLCTEYEIITNKKDRMTCVARDMTVLRTRGCMCVQCLCALILRYCIYGEVISLAWGRVNID